MLLLIVIFIQFFHTLSQCHFYLIPRKSGKIYCVMLLNYTRTKYLLTVQRCRLQIGEIRPIVIITPLFFIVLNIRTEI